MDFEFFESLSPGEAREHLRVFLEVGGAASESLVRAAAREGVRADFTIESIADVLAWIASQLSTVPGEPTGDIPWWIRGTESYKAGLFDFDEPSRILVLRGSYYLGESFVRSYPRRLSWNTGDRDTITQNMPVVAGFLGRVELAPMMVTENLMRDAAAGAKRKDDIATVIGKWVSLVPARAVGGPQSPECTA
jgi:hypothetical protein